MKSFKEFIKESASKILSAHHWEALIAVAYNGGGFENNKDILINAFKNEKSAKQIWESNEKIANKIAVNIKTKIKGNYMDHIGGGSGKISSFWVENGGSDPTPKTDILTNIESISLKKAGDSQLMSGGAGETKATFMAAASYISGTLSKEISIFANSIVDEFSSIWTEAPTKNMLELAKQLNSGGTPKEIEVKNRGTFVVDSELKQQAKDLFNQSLKHQKINEKIEEFSKNSKFKEFSAYEAISGEMKFNATKASANLIVVFDEKTGRASVKPTNNGKWLKSGGNIGSVIKEYANQVKFTVTFKSSTGKPSRRNSVMRAKVTSKIMEESSTLNNEHVGFFDIDNIIEQSYKENIGSFNLLCEEYSYLNESSFFKKIKEKILGFMKGIVNKIREVFNSIASMGKNAFKYILDFLGVDFSVSSTSVFTFKI